VRFEYYSYMCSCALIGKCWLWILLRSAEYIPKCADEAGTYSNTSTSISSHYFGSELSEGLGVSSLPVGYDVPDRLRHEQTNQTPHTTV
jgi:hypothetical protein